MSSTWRGAQVAPNTTPEDVYKLLLAGANILRYQFNMNYWGESVNILDSLVPVAASRGAKIILDVHQPITGTNPVKSLDNRIYFANAWEDLAKRFKAVEEIYAYGVLNEPAGSGSDVNQFNRYVYDAIRGVDPNKRVIVTCPYSDPTQFYKTKFINDDNVWYEAHMYLPMGITHQGIGNKPYPKDYPSVFHDKTKLRQYLRYVREFQKTNRARIYIGEFGISSFAPVASRVAYFRDCIEIFEEYGWRWTYHAWREAQVWDVEAYPAVLAVIKKAWEANN